MSTVSIEQVQNEIRRKNAKWITADPNTGRRSLASRDLRRSLGLNIDQGQLSRLRSAARVDVDRLISEFGKSSQRASGEVSVVDWRNYNGQNAVTSIKDQAQCGSCVAFGIAGTVESMAIIALNQQYDLSEAELFFCAGPQAGAGACPSGGWWPSNAMSYLRDKGLSKEECFPYSDQDTPCNTCKDRDNQAVYISKDVEILDINDRKKYIRSIGPMIGGMRVFADFQHYSEGVYSHVTGSELGGHCIQIIGYDDNQAFWICKNSWGTDFGESGFFKIAYGEPDTGIDTEFPFWGVAGIRHDTARLETIRRGSRGNLVVSLQGCLSQLGYDLGPAGIDGIFGPATDAAVRRFQRDNGLQIDGIVGPKTWGVISAKCPSRP
jgi:C1A family cysteine protease